MKHFDKLLKNIKRANMTFKNVFKYQKEFMTKILNKPAKPTIKQKHLMIKELMLAIMCEAAEVLDEKQGGIQWKSWRKWKNYSKEDFLKHCKYISEELIDLFHFLIEAMIVWGLTPEKVLKEYKRKLTINVERQKNNY